MIITLHGGEPRSRPAEQGKKINKRESGSAPPPSPRPHAAIIYSTEEKYIKSNTGRIQQREKK